jgi:hypothetical protein
VSGEPPPEGPDPAEDPSPLTPPGPPAAPPPFPASGQELSSPAAGRPPFPPPAGAEPNPYAAPSGWVNWWLLLIGIPVGFVAWVVGSFLVIIATGTMGGSSGGNVVALVLLVLLLIASIGLIVWRRTRRLAQGFVLGAAIGLVVAGGLCLPLVSSF